MDLNKVRQKIDSIDFEILKLLNERMEYALSSSKFKKNIEDSHRENALIERIKNNHYGLIHEDFSEKLFRTIIEHSKTLQKKKYYLTGFQGEHGAYSEMAGQNYLEHAALIPCYEFSDVFDGVEKGYMDYGIVPVENSLGGMIGQVNELLVTRDIKVKGEIIQPIHHHLMALPESSYQDIKVVVSHPQALSQCRGFLQRHKLEGRPYYDTAGAAKMLFQERPESTAVIANELCAELYNLEILMENVEDHKDNVTRFFIITKNQSLENKVFNKCSVVFSINHKAGALFNVLKLFSENAINLTRIESLPMGIFPDNYAFFLDFMWESSNEECRDFLNEVEKVTSKFKILGFYSDGSIAETQD